MVRVSLLPARYVEVMVFVPPCSLCSSNGFGASSPCTSTSSNGLGAFAPGILNDLGASSPCISYISKD